MCIYIYIYIYMCVRYVRDLLTCYFFLWLDGKRVPLGLARWQRVGIANPHALQLNPPD